jgi:hypothetical protein
MVNRALRLNLPLALLISAVIMAAVAAIHLGFHRPLICKCGYVKLFWMGPKSAPEESQHIFDLYSISHVLHGLIFYFLIWLLTRGRLSLGAGLVIAVLVEGVWELFENSDLLMKRYGVAGVEYSGDSIINSLGDIVSMMAGFIIAGLAPVWLSLLLLVGSELWMLWFMRDNLTLNIMNLIHPIDWINVWQKQKY